MQRALLLGTITPEQAAAETKRQWLATLDSPLRQHAWPPVRWNLVLGVVAALLATAVAAMWWRARQTTADRPRQDGAGSAFIAPWVFGFLVLTLGPMLASLVLSFTKWSAMAPLGGADRWA